jgi:alkylation response protein AidB-like acyl-CoA dehydrogenase
LGIARASLEAATAYAAKRRQFGRPIGEFESVGNMLADMSADFEAARLLVYRAAARRDAGRGSARESATVKMFASRAAVRAADAAVQIHGGHGYTAEYPVERFWRDAKLTEIGEGTTQVQQIVIALALLKEAAGT